MKLVNSINVLSSLALWVALSACGSSSSSSHSNVTEDSSDAELAEGESQPNEISQSESQAPEDGSDYSALLSDYDFVLEDVQAMMDVDQEEYVKQLIIKSLVEAESDDRSDTSAPVYKIGTDTANLIDALIWVDESIAELIPQISYSVLEKIFENRIKGYEQQLESGDYEELKNYEVNTLNKLLELFTYYYEELYAEFSSSGALTGSTRDYVWDLVDVADSVRQKLLDANLILNATSLRYKLYYLIVGRSLDHIEDVVILAMFDRYWLFYPYTGGRQTATKVALAELLQDEVLEVSWSGQVEASTDCTELESGEYFIHLDTTIQLQEMSVVISELRPLDSTGLGGLSPDGNSDFFEGMEFEAELGEDDFNAVNSKTERFFQESSSLSIMPSVSSLSDFLIHYSQRDSGVECELDLELLLGGGGVNLID